MSVTEADWELKPSRAGPAVRASAAGGVMRRVVGQPMAARDGGAFARPYAQTLILLYKCL